MAGFEERDTEGQKKETHRLIVNERAKKDFHDAYNWLEDSEAGLGEKLFVSYESALKRIQRSPTLYQIIHKTIRVAPLTPFRYRILFTVTGTTIKIIGLIHTSRHDREWKSRVRGQN